jgi:predicted DNA-binding transcriptional regulator AlpA
MNTKTSRQSTSRDRSDRAARPGDRPDARPAQVTAAERLWEVRDVAAYLRLSVGAIYKMTGPKAASPIPHMVVARKLRFRQADIDDWLALKTISSHKPLLRMQAALTKGTHHGHHQQKETG